MTVHNRQSASCPEHAFHDASHDMSHDMSHIETSCPEMSCTEQSCAGMSRRQLLKLAAGALAATAAVELLAPADILAHESSPMRIVMLTGSPHRRGTSALLADEFAKGAMAKGHSVQRFDTAFEDIGPCKACYYCAQHNGECIQKDAMQTILPAVLAADMVVLVTPLYFFQMSAQPAAATRSGIWTPF